MQAASAEHFKESSQRREEIPAEVQAKRADLIGSRL
jgi:hypothetical protein